MPHILNISKNFQLDLDAVLLLLDVTSGAGMLIPNLEFPYSCHTVWAENLTKITLDSSLLCKDEYN